MKYFIQSKNLIIDSKILEFKWPIEKVIEFNDCLIVMIYPAMRNIYNENIFGVSLDGKILWQIPEVKHIREDSPYTNIAKEKDNTVYACNWDGGDLWLDPKTGKILREGFSK